MRKKGGKVLPANLTVVRCEFLSGIREEVTHFSRYALVIDCLRAV